MIVEITLISSQYYVQFITNEYYDIFLWLFDGIFVKEMEKLPKNHHLYLKIMFVNYLVHLGVYIYRFEVFFHEIHERLPSIYTIRYWIVIILYTEVIIMKINASAFDAGINKNK